MVRIQRSLISPRYIGETFLSQTQSQEVLFLSVKMFFCWSQGAACTSWRSTILEKCSYKTPFADIAMNHQVLLSLIMLQQWWSWHHLLDPNERSVMNFVPYIFCTLLGKLREKALRLQTVLAGTLQGSLQYPKCAEHLLHQLVFQKNCINLGRVCLHSLQSKQMSNIGNLCILKSKFYVCSAF